MLEENSNIHIPQPENSETGLQFQKLASDIVEEIKKNIAPQNDGHDNLQYLPCIVHPIIRLFRMLPLWSGLMVPFFKYGSIPASSAAVETNFNILKNLIFSNTSLLIRLDDFLLTHIKSLDGTMKLASVPRFQSISLKNQDPGKQNLQADTTHTQTDQNDEVLMREYGNLNTIEKKTSHSNFQTTCPCCSKGNYLDQNGSYKCFLCKIPAHALEGCSLPAPNSEKGYGQKRICQICSKNSETEKRRI